MGPTFEDAYLRKPVEADAPRILDAVRDSLLELGPWMPWASASYDIDCSKSWIAGEFGDRERFILVDRTGRVLGAAGLNGFDDANRRANLGYWLRAGCTGSGLATRAVRTLIQHGFENTDLERMELVMSVENGASLRVAERAGARHEGIARARIQLHGRAHDCHVLSVTRAEAPALLEAEPGDCLRIHGGGIPGSESAEARDSGFEDSENRD